MVGEKYKNSEHARDDTDLYHIDNTITRKSDVDIDDDTITSKSDVKISAHAQSPCPNSKKEKVILLYTPKRWEDEIIRIFPDFMSDCSCRCQLILDRTKFEESDAVIFVIDLMPKVTTIPKKRNGQVWIFSQFESADYIAKEVKLKIMDKRVMDKFKRAVNWTMGYRRDSDFVFVHGDFSTRSGGPDEHILDKVREDYKSKSETAAWFVSHCKTMSKREDYVELMRKDIKVDEYGACANRKLPNCPQYHILESWGLRPSSSGACSNVLDEKHKFYLSFENSLCRDYVTEKSLHHVMRHSVIPVMRSGANHTIFNPPHSFIDASEFSSVRDLTLFLKILGSKPKEMFKYFEWKKFYTSEYPIKNWQRSMCEICRRLYEPEKYSRLYEDLHKWIMKPNDEDACYFPKDLFWK
ncbi:hypothetical protein FSP39_000305 [Pinctada imbricata]|uniref:Fucosyltransferase n=1 Tax=Pinctada imbricata TaxID=66713 RepID=A0AA88XDB4_PINIB|nr:hypothetical protein FSP39_000305 [Pinctada imbricata]